jgi:poly(A) polymerase
MLTVRNDTKVELCGLSSDILSDASRRDFTVNCLYVDLVALVSSGSAPVLDPTRCGLANLRDGVLTTPVEAYRTMWLDPIRIMRGVRFHATLGFEIDRQVKDQMRRLVYLLTRVSVERVRAELERILVSGRLRSSFRLMQRLGILAIILPEVGRTHGFSQATPYHAYDLFSHSVRTAAKTPPDLILRLAGLLHDLGKYETRLYRGDRAVYYGHEEISAEAARSVLARLRFPKRIIGQVCFLVRNHMINYSRRWSDRAIRRFIRKMGDSLGNMLILAEADTRAQRPQPGAAAGIGELRSRIHALHEQGKMNLDLPIDGHTIMRILGIEEGPAVGEAKNFLLEQASGRAQPLTRAQCLRLLRRWARRPGRI